MSLPVGGVSLHLHHASVVGGSRSPSRSSRPDDDLDVLHITAAGESFRRFALAVADYARSHAPADVRAETASTAAEALEQLEVELGRALPAVRSQRSRL
jgi:hypothetical protein